LEKLKQIVTLASQQITQARRNITTINLFKALRAPNENSKINKSLLAGALSLAARSAARSAVRLRTSNY
jgi:hypothetical protein